MRSNISHSSRFHDLPSSSFFLCYTGVISPCAVSRLLYNFQNILIHNWAEISQQEKRTISLWGEFALRRIWQVMQHYPLPPIHPDPSYHIPVTWPTTPPPAPRAIDTQCQPPPQFHGTWRYLFGWKTQCVHSAAFQKWEHALLWEFWDFMSKPLQSFLLWFLTLSLTLSHWPFSPYSFLLYEDMLTQNYFDGIKRT